MVMESDDSDRVASILAGYASDAWFAETVNFIKEALRMDKGAYWKGFALVVPYIPAVKADILQELHDSSYAGHVEVHRTVHNVKHTGGLAWLRTAGSMSRAEMCVSATRVCKGRRLVS